MDVSKHVLGPRLCSACSVIYVRDLLGVYLAFSGSCFSFRGLFFLPGLQIMPWLGGDNALILLSDFTPDYLQLVVTLHLVVTFTCSSYLSLMLAHTSFVSESFHTHWTHIRTCLNAIPTSYMVCLVSWVTRSWYHVTSVRWRSPN